MLLFDFSERFFLEGRSAFGDNIEDEWFIARVIFHITSCMPDVVASICDTDGEFLLIEAAQYLPNWVQPDQVQNRVFIYQGSSIFDD